MFQEKSWGSLDCQSLGQGEEKNIDIADGAGYMDRDQPVGF
jgi:hypothetical protein